jgi:osmotically inducible protein OsmC
VPRIERNAQAAWEGNVARGAGSFSALSSGAFDGLPYSLATRIGNPEGKTSPEELLAAAHAGCFAMSLANELTQLGSPPDRLDVRVTCVVDEVEGRGHLVVASRVDVEARVSGLDPERFQDAVRAADGGCTMSALIRGSADVRVDARLAT